MKNQSYIGGLLAFWLFIFIGLLCVYNVLFAYESITTTKYNVTYTSKGFYYKKDIVVTVAHGIHEDDKPLVNNTFGEVVYINNESDIAFIKVKKYLKFKNPCNEDIDLTKKVYIDGDKGYITDVSDVEYTDVTNTLRKGNVWHSTIKVMKGQSGSPIVQNGKPVGMLTHYNQNKDEYINSGGVTCKEINKEYLKFSTLR